MSRSIQANPNLLLWVRVLQMALVSVAIIPVFFAEELGLSTAEVMLVQGLFGLSAALGEVPSGYIADRFGYRRSLLIGMCLAVLCWLAYACVWDFWSVLVVELVLGVAIALVSGCDVAMLHRSLHACNSEREFGRHFARNRSLGMAAEGLAALAAGPLYAWFTRAPFLVETLTWSAGIWLVLRLVEPARSDADRPSKQPSGALREVLQVLRTRPQLRAIWALWTVLSLATYIPIWLIVPHAIAAGLPLVWVGVFWAIASLFAAGGSAAGPTLVQRLGPGRSALVKLTLLALGFLGLGLGASLWTVGFYFAISLTRGLTVSVLAPMEQRMTPDAYRATMISVRSMIFRVSFFLVGPLVGLAVDAHGRAAVFLGLGVVVPLLGLRVWQRGALSEALRSETPARSATASAAE